MAEQKVPARYIAPIADAQVAAGAGIASSKLADGGNFIKKDGTVAYTGDQSMGNSKITNLGTPTAGSNDAVRKIDLENAIAALNSLFDGKGSVRVVSTANATLATAYANGQTVDGVTIATGDRILLTGQTAQADNGIYTVNASGAPTRATDFDAWAEIPGGVITVEEGTTNHDTIWLSTANQGGTLNTTAITFFQIPTTSSGYTASNFVTDETPSGTVNGSNASFTIANTPVSGTVRVYLEGLRLVVGSGNDYTFSGTTITMTTAPLTGERLRADYQK